VSCVLGGGEGGWTRIATRPPDCVPFAACSDLNVVLLRWFNGLTARLNGKGCDEDTFRPITFDTLGDLRGVTYCTVWSVLVGVWSIPILATHSWDFDTQLPWWGWTATALLFHVHLWHLVQDRRLWLLSHTNFQHHSESAARERLVRGVGLAVERPRCTHACASCGVARSDSGDCCAVLPARGKRRHAVVDRCRHHAD
jgi:hypothetical protein